MGEEKTPVEWKDDPRVKELMKCHIHILAHKAGERFISARGLKFDLAVRIAKYDEQKASKDWENISSPPMK